MVTIYMYLWFNNKSFYERFELSTSIILINTINIFNSNEGGIDMSSNKLAIVKRNPPKELYKLEVNKRHEDAEIDKIRNIHEYYEAVIDSIIDDMINKARGK